VHVAQREGCISVSTSSGKKKMVTVLVYKHRHGEDVTVHATADSAEKQVYSYMELWMSEVPTQQQVAIRKAIKGRKLRSACDLWAQVFNGNYDGSETFDIYENLVVHG
jgi:hypothetical protein